MAVCREHGASRVLSWAPEWIGVPGPARGARGSRHRQSIEGWLPDGSDRVDRLAALDPIRVGITGAFAGIAESGTIAVVSGPGRSRLASLLVPVHIAVLRADRLYPSLAALLAAHADVVEEGSNLVLITGPSRTADIEMTLTRGVHGPGEIHVVLLGAGLGSGTGRSQDQPTPGVSDAGERSTVNGERSTVNGQSGGQRSSPEAPPSAQLRDRLLERARSHRAQQVRARVRACVRARTRGLPS